jgi:sortase A
MNPRIHSTKIVTRWRARLLHGASHLFFAFGVLALGYAAIVYADSQIYQDVEAQKFERTTASPVPRVLAQGDVMGEIQVPRLGINAIVIQGDSAADLRRAVGHLSSSALPGEWGNVALAGHRDTFFRPLRSIRVGDEIKIKAFQHIFEYRVESIEVVGPGDVRVLKATTGRYLTLLTCFPFHYVGPAPKRFVVHAREMDASR